MINTIKTLLRPLYRLIKDRNTQNAFLLNIFGIRCKPKLKNFPPMVMAEITTKCNLSCNHCPHSDLIKDKNWGGDMPFDLYKKIVDEIALKQPETIFRPFDSGEPLMRNDLEKMIKYANTKGIIYISINTNGTLLTKERAQRLLKAGLNHIEISVDAFSKETFKKIKNTDLYDTVLKNILDLITLKNTEFPHFKISLSFVKQHHNLAELDKFVDYWSAKVNYLNIREYHQHGNLVANQTTAPHIQLKHRHPCPYLWDRLIIHHDGKVRFCENDWKAIYTLGDINTQTIQDIWLSEGYQTLRNEHITGNFNHPFCKACSDWKVIK